MSQHPVTPMNEADVRLHLANQTKLPVELVDVLKLEDAARSTEEEGRADSIRSLRPASGSLSVAMKNSSAVVLLDTLREAHLPVIGRFISDQRPRGGQLFCAGSSGVEYALVAHWRETGRIRQLPATGPRQATTRSRIITVSGSCSPVTDRQIGYAA